MPNVNLLSPLPIILLGQANTWTGVQTLNSPVFVTPALGTPASGVLTNCTGLPSAGLVDGSVTLAKMANLAQDAFIGRVTASTGVPETATITAAARTVLDDTTVGAMVDTLGGAAATGTGGLARATSPTFVTPALGTPASGTLTNCTFPTLNQNTTGSAATLTTPRAINGVNFDGSAAITVTAAAGTLSGTTLNATVVASSLTSVGTLASPVLTTPDINGGTADALTSLGIRSTGTGAFDMTIANAENLAAGRTLTIQLGDAARTLILGASPSLSGTNTGDQTITLTGDVTGSGTGSFAATIANAAVTLAKMANLAQDQFIGRTTASTGVPETATITAAARTVLDDTTVAAMVDTLGGAASTGTGGLARATSPTFVTPALGTPASGVMTNVTGLPTAGLVDDAVTYAKMQNVSATDRVLGRTTAGAGDVEEIATTGSGNVVRATSPTLVTPALGTPASGVLTNVTGLPTAGLVDDAVSLAKMAAGTAGNLITYDASGNPAAVATGTATQVLTSNGAGAAPTFQAAGGAGALTRAGGNTTEATTTSATAVDLMTVASGLSIAATTPLLLINLFRKTSGAATTGGLGLKLNATVVSDAVAGSLQAADVCGGFTPTDRAETGVAISDIKAIVTDYAWGACTGQYCTWVAGGVAGVVQSRSDGHRPNATLTDVIIRGISNNVAITVGVDEAHVYTYATS